MPDKVKFRINHKLEISWNDDFYKSNIENVEKNTISISIPIKDGQYVPLRVGDAIEAIYYHESEIFKFSTTVIGRKSDTIPVILLDYPKEVFRIQRRRFVRVPVICFIVYKKIGRNQNGKILAEAGLKPGDLKGIMVDLSGGGTRIKLHEQIEIGDVLEIHMPLGNDKVYVKGEVVRVEFDEVNKLNSCGISFINLGERDRDKIIKFIFQEMRNQMKKGLNK